LSKLPDTGKPIGAGRGGRQPRVPWKRRVLTRSPEQRKRFKKKLQRKGKVDKKHKTSGTTRTGTNPLNLNAIFRLDQDAAKGRRAAKRPKEGSTALESPAWERTQLKVKLNQEGQSAHRLE